jgi:hypothetical protein
MQVLYQLSYTPGGGFPRLHDFSRKSLDQNYSKRI